MTPEEVELYWNKKVKVLEGKTIKSVKYMTKERAEEWDWYKRPIEITFTDGNRMILSRDDEGNGPGSAFTSIKGLERIPTI